MSRCDAAGILFEEITMSLSLTRGLLAAASVLTSMVAWANSYAIVDLGHFHYPLQVNNNGQVAAIYEREGRDWRALALRDEAWHRLDETQGQALTIDLDGTAAGSTFSDDQYTPYTWAIGGKRRGFDLPLNGTGGQVMSLLSGQVVGQYVQPGSSYYHCFLGRVERSKTKDLGVMGGTQSCNPVSINSTGQVAGSAQRLGDGNSRAFIWSDDTFTDLGTLPNSNFAYANAMNDAGHIVGVSGTTSEAFVWINGVMTDIGDPTKYIYSEAASINNQDVIVGGGTDSSAHQNHHALRFEAGTVVDLEKEVINIGSWHLNYATSINDNGVIVGSGRLDGEVHGFMLIPHSWPGRR